MIKTTPGSFEAIKGIRGDLEGLFEKEAPAHKVMPVAGKRGNLPTMADAVGCLISGWQTLDKAVREAILNSCVESMIEAWKAPGVKK